MYSVFKSTKSLPSLKESHHGVQSIAIDAGSTETRGVVVLSDDLDLSDMTHIHDVQMCKLLSVPSGYATIPIESRLGRPSKHDTIADKLEYLIAKESGPDIGWTKIRVLKGSLMEASARSVCKVTSSLLKVQQSQTYINIIATIANMFLSKSITSGKAFREVMPVDLTVALPYEDIYSSSSIDIFKEKLSGTYKVILPRIPVDKVIDGKVVDEDDTPIEVSGKPAKKIPYFVKFTLTKDSIMITSEQNAVAEYYSCFFDEDDEDMEGGKSRTAIIDVGGRNTAMLLNKQSGMDESIQMTFDDGGSRILKDIGDAAIKEFSLTTVSEDQALQAFTTGKMNYGGQVLDCLNIVNRVKQSFANTLYQNYTLFLDSYSTKVNSVQTIVVSGRSFKSITKGEDIISPSIKSYLEDLCAAVGTKVISIGTEYPIPWGLIQCRMGKVDEDYDYTDNFDIDF